MATTTPLLGKNLTIQIGSTVITNLRSNSLSMMTDMIDVTTKSSGTHKEYLPSWQDLTLDAEGIYTKTASSQGVEDFLTSKLAGTSVSWVWGDGVSAAPRLTGTGYITSIDFDAPMDDVVTFTISIQNTGDPTNGVYP